MTGFWRVVRPLLVAVSLSGARLFNQLLQWSLERINPEAKAAAASESSRIAFLITTATLGILLFLGGSLINPAPSAGSAQPVVKAAPAATARNTALLEKVQAQVSDVVESYGLAGAADLKGDRLTIILEDDWYRLSDKQQQRVARQLLQRIDDSDVAQITLLNQREERIARTPVVGDRFVFFQTDEPPAPPEVPDILESPEPPPAAGDLSSETSEGLDPASTADSASPAAASPSPSSPAEPALPE